MLQRTLASLFLFTLLLAQTLSGVCRTQCDRASSHAASSCHGMSMDTGSDRVSAPCVAHPCTSDAALLVQAAQQETAQQHLSSHVANSLYASSLAPFSALAMPHTTSPPKPLPVSPASSPRTALRV